MSTDVFTMPKRRFGRTELQMPVISTGGMRYQQSWKDEPLSDIAQESMRNVEACIKRSIELGINHIETARGYGTSEIQLGQILPHITRDDLIVQTKVGPNEDAQAFVDTFEKCMSYLCLDYINLLGIHGINNRETLEWTLRPGGCMEKALQWKKEGRVRHIGFSTHGPTDVIVDAINTGQFDYVNLHWYYVNDLNWAAIEAATAQDMGVFIISPNDKGGKLYEPSEKLVDLCGDVEPMAFNNMYCLSRNEVHTLSLGASKPSDYDAHVDSMQYYDRAEEISAPIAKRLNDAVDAVMGDGWVANWSKGLPEFYDLPNEINVQEILRLYTYAKGLDLVDWGKMRYNLLGNAGHWFPGTMAVDFDDAVIKDKCADNPFVDQLPEMLRDAHTLMFDEPKKRLSESDDE